MNQIDTIQTICFSEDVLVPHIDPASGTFYLKSRKVNLFGISDEQIEIKINGFLDEG